MKKLLILCGLLMSGCVKDGPNTTDFKEWLLACPNPFEAHPDGPVIARGGDVVVRASEFRRWVQGTTGGRIPVDIPVETRRRVLDQVLYRKVVTKIGKEAGVQMNPLALQTVENLQFTYLMSALIHSLPASDEEMRSYYHLHAKEILPSEVLVSRILLKSLAQAQKAQALLKKGRPAPGLLKDQFSPTDRGRMDPEVARVIFALKPGQVSDPLKTMDGFEVIRREKLPPQALPPYEAVKEQVRSGVQVQKLSDLYQQRMSTMKIDVDENLLNSIDLSSTTAATPLR